MTDKTTREAVRRVLSDIAPEIDVASIDATAVIRDEVDIDSMDFLNFVVALGAEFDISISELDYPELDSVASCARYVERKLASRRESETPQSS